MLRFFLVCVAFVVFGACANPRCPPGEFKIADTCYPLSNDGGADGGDDGSDGDELSPGDVDSRSDAASLQPQSSMDASVTAVTGARCANLDEDFVNGACVKHDDCAGVTSCSPGMCVDDVRSYFCSCPSTHNTLGTQPPACKTRVWKLALGYEHSCVLLATGAVKCWGANYEGNAGTGTADGWVGDRHEELGDNLLSVQLGKDRKVTALALGMQHSCALLEGGLVKCWGYNSNGQLGLGDSRSRGKQPNEMGDNLPSVDLGTAKRAMAIAAGGDQTCALLEDRTVKCWGDGVGDAPGEMGDVLPVVPIGSGRKAASVTVGMKHACAMLDGGGFKCWGSNWAGQLGLGDARDRTKASDLGDLLPFVDLGLPAISVQASGDMTCAILQDGRIKCWGSNESGALGLGDGFNRGVAPGQIGSSLPAVDLGLQPARLLAVGDRVQNCALLANDDIKCWGAGVGDAPGEMGAALVPIDTGTRGADAIESGAFQHCVLTAGEVHCWGRTEAGVVGAYRHPDKSPLDFGSR